MCDITLAFGEGNTYHLECPSRWSLYVATKFSLWFSLINTYLISKNLPQDLSTLYQNGSLVTTYSMALGPSGGFVCTYKAKTELTHLSMFKHPVNHNPTFSDSPDPSKLQEESHSVLTTGSMQKMPTAT